MRALRNSVFYSAFDSGHRSYNLFRRTETWKMNIFMYVCTHIHTTNFYFSRFRPKDKVTLIDSQMLSKVVKSGRLNNAHVDSISTSKLTLTLRNMNFKLFCQ